STTSSWPSLLTSRTSMDSGWVSAGPSRRLSWSTTVVASKISADSNASSTSSPRSVWPFSSCTSAATCVLVANSVSPSSSVTTNVMLTGSLWGTSTSPVASSSTSLDSAYSTYHSYESISPSGSLDWVASRWIVLPSRRTCGTACGRSFGGPSLVVVTCTGSPLGSTSAPCLSIVHSPGSGSISSNCSCVGPLLCRSTRSRSSRLYSCPDGETS